MQSAKFQELRDPVEYMDKVVELVDERIRNNVPEGVYLDLMNALKTVQEQLPNPEHPDHDNFEANMDIFRDDLSSLHWTLVEPECHRSLISKLVTLLKMAKERNERLHCAVVDLAVAYSNAAGLIREQPILDTL